MFDLDRIRSSSAVASLEHHATLPSTSDRAKQLCLSPGLSLPLLVLCDTQTAGRGRGANRWWSAGGGLTFSWVIDPAAFALGGERLPALSLTTALAVCRAAERVAGAQLSIKWPNDVVCARRRKLAGILLESPRPGAMIVGVGCNVGDAPAGAEGLDADRVCSIAELTGREVDPTEMLLAILEELSQLIDRLAGGDQRLHAEWSERDALLHASIELETPSGKHWGHCEGISPEGALRLNDGRVTTEHLSGSISAVL